MSALVCENVVEETKMPAASNVAVMLVSRIRWHRVCDKYNLFCGESAYGKLSR